MIEIHLLFRSDEDRKETNVQSKFYNTPVLDT